MASVWYTGRADSRTITAAQWAAAGVAGATTNTWDVSNGWSIPANQFTAAQVALLDQMDFNTTAPDGPRPGAAVASNDQRPVRFSDLVGLGLTSSLIDDRVRRRAVPIMAAYDRANQARTLSVGAYAHLPLRLVVPPTDYDITIKYGAWWSITTAGAGIIGIGISDTTGGVLSEITLNSEDTVGRSGVFTLVGNCIRGEKDLDKSANWRTFRMLGAVFRDASSSLAATVAASNASGGAAGNRSAYMKVVPQ